MNIWVNGCFDIIHSGHIELFKYAKSLGTKLFVGIDSDIRVEKLKGSKRPILSQDERKKILEAIRYIDEVVIFESEIDLEDQIKKRNIDILVVGAAYADKRVVGVEFSKQINFFPLVKGKSTTSIIEKILKAYQDEY